MKMLRVGFVALMLWTVVLGEDKCSSEIMMECKCPSGDACERHVSEDGVGRCSDYPCMNGGTCVDDGEMTRCDCAKLYYGERCEMAMPCAHNPCYGSGLCNDWDTTKYICQCVESGGGEDCKNHEGRQYITSPWTYCGQTCENGGSCMRNMDGDEFCDCPPGFYGLRCQHSYECQPICGRFSQRCTWGPGMAMAWCKDECEVGAPGCVEMTAGVGGIKGGIFTIFITSLIIALV